MISGAVIYDHQKLISHQSWIRYITDHTLLSKIIHSQPVNRKNDNRSTKQSKEIQKNVLMWQ